MYVPSLDTIIKWYHIELWWSPIGKSCPRLGRRGGAYRDVADGESTAVLPSKTESSLPAPPGDRRPEAAEKAADAPAADPEGEEATEKHGDTWIRQDTWSSTATVV